MQPQTPPSASISEVMAENARAALAARGLSQRDLADALKWSEARVSRRLNALSAWPIEDAVAVATFLDMDLDDLRAPEKATA